MKWNGTTGLWNQCRATGYAINSVSSWAIGWAPNWGTAPCGNGYYENWTDAHAWDAGAWRGGTVYSDYFTWLLPAFAAVGTDQLGPPPPDTLDSKRDSAKADRLSSIRGGEKALRAFG